MRILILNGPNLNLLGQREPGVYGTSSLEDLEDRLQRSFPEHELEQFQSNHEGELIDRLHRGDKEMDGIVINPGGYTHTSIALGDAVSGIRVPVIEVHISNIFAREEFRHRSYLSAHCKGTISGLGLAGYEAAIQWLIDEGE